MIRFALIPCLLLNMCQSTSPVPVERIVVQTVDRPVPVSCIPADLPDAPARAATPQALGAHPNPADLIVALTEEVVHWRGWGDQVAPVIRACRRAGQQSPAGGAAPAH